MATVNAPFAAGTISAISGNNITVTGATVATTWVGRAVVLNRNIANSTRGGQWREITAVNTTTNTITIEYTWRVAELLEFNALTRAFVENINTTNGHLTITGHSFADGEYVGIFSSELSPPSGSSSFEVYFCDVIDSNTIRLCTNSALTTPLTLTDEGFGDIYVVRDPDLEATPVVGDAIHISTEWDDIDNGTTIIKVDALLYRRAGNIAISGNTTIYAKGITFDFGVASTSNFSVSQNAGLIFGGYNSAQQAVQGCLIRYSAPPIAVQELWGTSAAPGGDIQFFGCEIVVATSTNEYFQRLNRGTQAIARLIDCSVTGNFGGRYQGARSIIRNTVFTGSTSGTGCFSTAAPFGQTDRPITVNSRQSMYWLWQFSGSGSIRNVVARNLTTQLINISNTSGGASAQTLRIINPDYDNSAPTFIRVENVNTTANQKRLDYGFELKLKALFSGALSGGGRIALYNALQNEVFNGVSATGLYADLFLPQRSFLLPSSGASSQNIPFAAGTLLSPYTARFRQYGFEFLTQALEASAPLSFDWFKVMDNNITEPSKSIVDAYTGFSFNSVNNTITLSENVTNAQIYDRTRAYLVDNMSVPIFGSFVKSNGQLTLDWNIILSSPLTTTGSIVISGSRTISLLAAGVYTKRFEIPATATVVVSPGSTDLSTWSFASGATINSSGGPATVTVANPTGIVAGANVTLVIPLNTIQLTGLPNTPATKLLVKNLTTNVENFYTITGTSISIETNPNNIYRVRADAPGYLASDFVDLPGNTPQFRFNLTDITAIYNAGVTRFDRVVFNPTTYRIFITDGPDLSFADVIRTLEDYLVGESGGVVLGLLYTAHPIPVVIPGRNIIRFPYDTVAGALNPARISPHPSNTADPALLFEIELVDPTGVADPTYGLLDFSTNPGRIVRVRSQVAIANVAVSGGLSPADRAVINSIDDKSTKVAKRFALVNGVSTTYTNTAISSSDGAVDITLTDNGGGSYTATPN